MRERRGLGPQINPMTGRLRAHDTKEERYAIIQDTIKNRRCWQRIRFKILDRDGFRCQYCGLSPRDSAYIVLHIDHIMPRSRGGDDSEKNLITSCNICNAGKGDKCLTKHP